ncbi:hypothetical protein B0H13DRAFT_1971902 [Mycena leptocephala]|nr:hypothetical protein B0H13DRAFT_1971902 [Mycena leptocephala]
MTWCCPSAHRCAPRGESVSRLPRAPPVPRPRPEISIASMHTPLPSVYIRYYHSIGCAWCVRVHWAGQVNTIAACLPRRRCDAQCVYVDACACALRGRRSCSAKRSGMQMQMRRGRGGVALGIGRRPRGQMRLEGRRYAWQSTESGGKAGPRVGRLASEDQNASGEDRGARDHDERKHMERILCSPSLHASASCRAQEFSESDLCSLLPAPTRFWRTRSLRSVSVAGAAGSAWGVQNQEATGGGMIGQPAAVR